MASKEMNTGSAEAGSSVHQTGRSVVDTTFFEERFLPCQAVSSSQNVCTKHELQPLNFFCKHCLIPVCHDCTVLDHKEQQGHIIVDVTQALSETFVEFVQVEEKFRQNLEKMKTHSDSFANASKLIDMQEIHQILLIKRTFRVYRDILTQHSRDLHDKLQETIFNHMFAIYTRYVSVFKNGTQLQKLFDSFSEAKTSNNVQQLFTLHKKLKDLEKQFTTAVTLVDEDLSKSCTFESSELLTEKISSLGEVSIKEDLLLRKPIMAQQLVHPDVEEHREHQCLVCDLRAFWCEKQEENEVLDELTTADTACLKIRHCKTCSRISS